MTLDESISPGQTGHITDHQTIAEILNDPGSAAAFTDAFVEVVTETSVTAKPVDRSTTLKVVTENRVVDVAQEPLDIATTPVRVTVQHGSASVDALGTDIGIASEISVLGSADNDNEYAAFFGVVRMGTDTKAANGRAWLGDFGVHGPIGEQAEMLTGITMFMNNYHNSVPIAGPGAAFIAVTKMAEGPAKDGAGHDTANTYPLDVGVAVVGRSRAAAVDGVGWEVGVKVGGWASGWMGTGERSIIGTGVEVTDYVDYGLYIHDRHPLSGAAANTRAARFGGDVDLDNNIAVRGLATDGTTLRTLMALKSSNQTVIGDSNVVGNLVGSSVQIQTGGTVKVTVGSFSMTLADGIALVVGSTSGTKIGSATTQKIGFWNATPVVRPSGVAVTAEGIHAALVTIGLIAA